MKRSTTARASTGDKDQLATSSAFEPGKLVFCGEAWKCMASDMRLSLRELQILQQLLDDKKETVIATSLGISPHTIHTHIERLYRKLGVRSRVEMALCAAGSFLRMTADPRRKLPPICGTRTAGACPMHAVLSPERVTAQ